MDTSVMSFDLDPKDDPEGFVMVDRPDQTHHQPPTAVESRKSRRCEPPPKLPPPVYLTEISTYIDNLTTSLWPINKTIHDNPELGFDEVIAHETLTAFMETQPGWTVTRSAYGMTTAFVAIYGSGSPVVSFNAEMDALPGIGHACGHNLIATASVAAALATAYILSKHQLPAKVVLFGTPAEEGGGGKIKLLNAGAYTRDHKIDISLIAHPGSVPDAAMVTTTAYVRFRVEYFGREAHAAAEPWKGINALDALITAYNGLSVLRQQTMAGDVIQGHITDGGAAPNIIHAYAAGVFVVRSHSQKRLDELLEKVEACFRAGALATGATLRMTRLGAYRNHVPNRTIAERYARYFNELDPPTRIREDQNEESFASSDQGDVSFAVPSLMPGFAIPTRDGAGPHTPGFAEASGTREAFGRCLRVAKGLAGAAVDVVAVDGVLERVKEDWRRGMRDKEEYNGLGEDVAV
ncbi:hypothetical protein B0H66DRAFT_624747 [Apodospora peruviana]|uniref:Peptidase M20 domain-containing protein 2 n=1 Tax=Apodospora peruviana TaxID=516989 RepID=A0AAE0I0M6_9PEZI|nr:hypothetical protein B0H66DRAFT_624747 [Apodospora peruviana]